MFVLARIRAQLAFLIFGLGLPMDFLHTSSQEHAIDIYRQVRVHVKEIQLIANCYYITICSINHWSYNVDIKLMSSLCMFM